ncbi:hypothetical protein WKR88_13200 [Trinickia caryophylli]|uniref:Uncharacterized protein n=1 Tax=Trinickia caryophylli TaxID=28094 RepID=A0A1X7H5A5_TRICW|nr:hypothetical protein [Trinickia caryophylli]WQE12010.1 hypothetical protein U0034_00825 [Trinickia caryophylli]SMF79770.1 hypothetical protein SAMN06295900_12190 [Trinickia caryophylli]
MNADSPVAAACDAARHARAGARHTIARHGAIMHGWQTASQLPEGAA